MKVRLSIALLIGLVLVLGLAGMAQAQSFCDTISNSVESGAPGDEVTVCGSSYSGATSTLYFDGVEVGSAVADEYDDYCITFDVPADAVDGEHELMMVIEGEGTVECFTDFVVAGVAEIPVTETPAPVAGTTTRLPETGFMFLPVAGALMAGGLGAVLSRKQRR